MKNILLLFLFLIPAFLFAQYPTGTNKSRLGYQTTGDGLIWRGVAADTAVKPRTTANAYFQLDTVNRILRRYIATQGSWQVVGGGSVNIDSLIYATRYWVGSNFFPLEGGTLTGTGGAGFIGLPSQGTAPGTPVSGLNIFAQGSSFNWKGTDGFERQITSSLTGGRNYALPDINGTFALGTGTTDLSARWTGTNTLGAGSWSDNLTRLQAQVPVQFQSWTTAGRPSGVTGYMGYNTTLGYQEFYDGTTWFPTGFWAKSGTAINYAAGKIGINSASPTEEVEMIKTINGSVNYSATNLSTGTSAASGFVAKNSGGGLGSMFKIGTGYSTYKTLTPNSFGVYNNTSGNISFLNDWSGGNIIFAAGGSSTAQMSLISNGKLLLGTTSETDALGFSGTSNGNLNLLSGSSIFSFSGNSNLPYFAVTNGSGVMVFGGHANPTDGGVFGTFSNHKLTLRTNNVNRLEITAGGNLLLGTTTDVSRRLHVSGEARITDTATDPPTGVLGRDNDGDIGTFILGSNLSISSGTLNSTWLKPQLEAGSVTINAATNADLFINNLDSVKFGKTLIRSSNNSLLILNPDVGATGIATFGAGYHTVINGIVNGTDGGTGHIVTGGTVTANTTGSVFGMANGYASNVTNAAYGQADGYNADVTADNGAAFGRNALADETGEMSLGSSIYSKINLWTNTGDIFAKGDVIAEDSVKITTRPSMPSATDIAVYDASGWLGYRDVSTLSNGIISALPLGNVAIAAAGNSLTIGGMSELTLGGTSWEIYSDDFETNIYNAEYAEIAAGTGAKVTLDNTSELVEITGNVTALRESYYEINTTTSPATFSSSIPDNFVNQGSTQASFTFLFPASPEDGQILSITWGNAISTLTLDGNGNTITGSAVTTAVAGTRRQFKYYASAATWIKIY